MYIVRNITSDITKHLFQGKLIVIYGPRRVGKTTLVKKLADNYEKKYKTLYLTGDNLTVQQNLTTQDALKLKKFLGDANLVIVDEAQRINNIGINLKIMTDAYPEIQIIATGSSSFDLSNKINEPLTGRKWEYFLPPLTISELGQIYKKHEIVTLLDSMIKFGFYPEIVTSSISDTQKILEQITNDYLFKDILMFEGQKNSEFVFKLLQLLAFQVGNEVSYNELASTLGVSKVLVKKYIHLLEQTYVIFRLGPLSRNLQNEVGKKRKIYFWDTGIRNTLIQNFNDPIIRQDIGGLWENFCIAERVKYLKINQLFRNLYYWRTYDQKELDYLEEYNGEMHAYEIKWKKTKIKKHQDFLKSYHKSSIRLVNKENFWNFTMIE